MNVFQRSRWFPFVAFAAVLLAYLPVRSAGFIWDDEAHVTDNPTVVGPQGLKEIWTTAAANYFPLTMTSFWVQHALWGLDPQPYHWVSVVMHGLAAVVLFGVLRRLRVPWPWLGALLWALHPVQVESVAWISELKNTQSAVFYLLAIWFFVRWLDRGGPESRQRADYGWAFACAVLATLSKSSTVMLPVVLGLIGWWRGERRVQRIAWLAPFLLVSVVASGWTIWEQKVHSMASGAEWALSLAQRAALSGKVVWFYLAKLCWPQPLVFIYPRWEIDASRLGEWIPALGVLGAAMAGFILLRRRPEAGRVLVLAGGYFVASLFPVLGFFDVFFFRYSFVGDHLQYLASIGPLVLAGAMIGAAFERGRWGAPRLRLVLPAGLLMLLGFLSWRQCRIYQNIESLWQDTVNRNPRAWIAQNNLGRVLLDTGRAPLALVHFETASKLHPNDPAVLTNLGNAFIELRRPLEAIPVLGTAVRLNPKMAEAHNSLGYASFLADRAADATAHYEEAIRLKPDYGAAYYNFGQCLIRQQDLAGALERFEAALRTHPRAPIYRNAVGQTLLALGRGEEASGHFQTALAADPNNPEAHAALARLAVQQGRLAEAAAHAEAALRLRADQPFMRHVLGQVLWRAGRPTEAVPQYEAELRARPELLEPRAELGVLLFQLGRPAEALPHFERLQRLQPRSPEAHNNTGSALLQLGKIDDAIERYTEAVRLKPDYVDARANLGSALARAGRLGEAGTQWEEILKLQPGNQGAQRALAEIRATPPSSEPQK